MADNTGIGDLIISVGADLSAFEAALDQLPGLAAGVAQQVNAAFQAAGTASDALSTSTDQVAESLAAVSSATSGADAALTGLSVASASVATATDEVGTGLDDISTAATGLDTSVSSVDDSMSALADALNSTDEAVNETASSLGDLEPELEQAGESSEEAGEGLQGMAEQLVQLGEALAITEGLKDFAEEAVEAYESVQQVTASLTALDGSAELASESVEKLEGLAIQDGLAMPNVLIAGQRMQLAGVSAEQLTGLMTAVAEATDASGKSFDTVAQKMTMMVASGNASARALQTIGINAQTLAAAINATAGQDVANIDNIAAAFKGLSESQRVDVLESAFSQYGSVVQIVSQQVAGQLNTLGGEWHQVMAAIGSDIAPVVAAVLSFANTAVIPAIQSMVQWFNQLPGPVKEGATVIALLVAAIVPVALAVGGFGLAVSAASIAIGGLTTAAGLLDISLAPLLLIPIAIVAIVASLALVAGGIENLARQNNTFGASLTILLGLLGIFPGAAQQATAATQENTQAVGENTGAQQPLISSTGALGKMMAAAGVNVDALTQRTQASTVVLLNAAQVMHQVQQAAEDVATNVVNANNVFSQTAALFSQGQATASQYTAALEAMNKAQLAANNGFQQTNTALLLVENTFRQLNTTAANTVVDFQAAQVAMALGQATLGQYTSALTAMNKAQQEANNGIELLGTAVLVEANNFKQLQVAATNAGTNLAAIMQDVAKGTSSFVQYDAALKQLNTDQMAVNGGIQDSHTALLLIEADYQQLQNNLTNALTQVDAVTQAFNSHKATIQQVSAALEKAQQDYQALNNGLTSFDITVRQDTVSQQELQTAATNATTAFQAALLVFNSTGQGLQNLIKTAENMATTSAAANNGALSWAAADAQLAAQQATLNTALINANTYLAQATQKLASGEIGIGVYNAALAKQKQAQDAVNGSTSTAATDAQNLAGKLPAVATGYQAVANAALSANGGLINSFQDTQNVSNAFSNLQINLQNATTHLNDVLQAVQNNTASMPQLQQAIQAVVTAQNALVGANQQYAGSAPAVVQQINAVANAAVQAASDIDDMSSAMADAADQSFSAAGAFGNAAGGGGLAGTVTGASQGGGGSGQVNPGGIFTQTINGVSENIMTTPGALGGFGKFAPAVAAAAEALAGTSSDSLTSAASATADTLTSSAAAALAAAEAADTAAASSQSTSAASIAAAEAAATLDLNLQQAADATAALTTSTTTLGDSMTTAANAATEAANSTTLLVSSVADAAQTISSVTNGINSLTSASTLLLGGAAALASGTNLGPNGANSFVPLNAEQYSGGIAPQTGQINITITAGTVVGQGGMQQLSTMLANQLVSTMQTQGIRLSRA